MYLQMQQNLSVHRTTCFSCTPVFYYNAKEKKKNFRSFCPHTMVRTLPDCANEMSTEQVGRICMSESLACPISKYMTLACDAASVSMDFSQAQVEEKNKLHTQKVGSNPLSSKSKVRGKGKTIYSETQVLPGAIVDFF